MAQEIKDLLTEIIADADAESAKILAEIFFNNKEGR